MGIEHPVTSGHSDAQERQSARMSKITNDGLSRSVTAHMATVGVKGLTRVECQFLQVSHRQQATGHGSVVTILDGSHI